MTARSPEDIHDELAKLFDSQCNPPCGYCGADDHIDKWLDNHPCAKCGGHYDDHHYLTDDDIKEAEKGGYTVSICDEGRQDTGPGSTLFCVVTPPPDNPCDSDFMEKISS